MYFLLLIAALIVYGSLYPWHFNFTRVYPDPLLILFQSWPSEWDIFAARDGAVNVCLYFPLGFAAFLAMNRRGSRVVAAWVAIGAGLILSTGMEIIQLYVPGRVTSAFDVVCDTAGAALGAIVAWRFAAALKAHAQRNYRRFASSAAALLACWVCYHLFPFFPQINIGRLRFEWMLLLHPNNFFATEIWASAADWFAAALAVQALVGRMRLRWLLAAVCFRLAVRPILITRPLGLEEVAGAALVAVLWSVLPARMRAPAGLFLLLSTILLRDLAPLGNSQVLPDSSWTPFHALFTYDRHAAAAFVSRKAFEYGSIVWLLHRAGFSYPTAGAALTAALAILIAVERYLPGQQISLTDALIAALMAITLGFTEAGHRFLK